MLQVAVWYWRGNEKCGVDRHNQSRMTTENLGRFAAASLNLNPDVN